MQSSALMNLPNTDTWSLLDSIMFQVFTSTTNYDRYSSPTLLQRLKLAPPGRVSSNLQPSNHLRYMETMKTDTYKYYCHELLKKQKRNKKRKKKEKGDWIIDIVRAYSTWKLFFSSEYLKLSRLQMRFIKGQTYHSHTIFSLYFPYDLYAGDHNIR